MNKSLIDKRTKKIICFLIIAILIMLTISLFAVPELDTNAYAAEYGMKVVFNRDYYPFYDTLLRPGNLIEIDIVWYSTDFYPIEEVLWITDIDDGGQVSGEDMQTYSWTMENLEDSSITYAGSCMNGNSSWSGGNYPTIAGVYNIAVSATYQNNTRVENEEITLRGYAEFNEKENNPFEIIYDGNDYYDMLDDGLPQQIDLNNCFSIVGEGSDGGLRPEYEGYDISYEWEMNITSVVEAGNYECELILTDNGVALDYIDYGYFPHILEEEQAQVSLGPIEQYFTNIREFMVQKRPIMLAPGVLDGSGDYVSGAVFVENEKRYNGNSDATAYLYNMGTGSDRFDYLLNATKFDDNSGILQSDLNSMITMLDSIPLLRFNDVTFYDVGAGENVTLNSHFYIINEFEEEVPSSTVSGYDEFGNVIYDKYIRIYFQPNVYYENVMRNYSLTLDGVNISDDYLTFDTVGAIVPGELTVSARSAVSEYGLYLSSMLYQLVTGGTQPQEGYIGVEWDGALLGSNFDLVHSQEEIINNSGVDNIQIMIKIARSYVPGVHSVNDIVFTGESSAGEQVQLVEYFNDLPPVIDLYFYPLVYYNGQEVIQNVERNTFQCGSLELKYLVNKLEIKKKQLLAPPEVIVYDQKEYDGLLQAEFENFTENSFDNQWVGDDGVYITARIKPVYDNPLAGYDKQITINYIMMLTDEGIAQNKSYLLDRYEQPNQETIEASITKKTIEFAFNMTNAEDKPNMPPYTNYLLFPEDKILTFTKPYGSPLPQINEFVFGDYVYDGFGDIEYEWVYAYKASTYIDNYGNEEFERDFYGNYVYVIDESVPPVLQPKLNNSFIYLDAYPNKIQFDDLIDWRFYGIPIMEGGTLKRIKISSYDPETNEVTIIDASTDDAVQMTVGENTPSTDNPGIGIQLLGSEGNEIELVNYIIKRKTTNYRAFIKITKRTPLWEMPTYQDYTYSGKQHSSMLDDINVQEPQEEDYDTYEEYLLAYDNYLHKKATFDKIININLNNHEDFLDIVGSEGKGININVIEYAPPGQELTQPVSAYIDENEITAQQILLIKHAGKYIIEVSLPETPLYSASEKKEVTLVIEQKEVTVWLSNSEKDYGQPNPDSSEILYKEDTSDTTTWGWRFYSSELIYYKSTILYQGFIEGEGPDNIGLKTFKHSEIVYINLEESSPPGTYYVTSQGAMAHNYSFICPYTATLVINKTRAEIILEKDEATVVYDPEKDAWTVEEIEDGVENPIAVYRNSASEDPEANIIVNVVGYAPRDEDYDFSVHYVYKKDEFGEIVYDEQGYPIILNFNPIVINYQGEWVAYEEGLTGEIRDCTPPIDYAKNVGQYIFKLTANPSIYLEPMARYVKFVIDYADTIVDKTEEIIIHNYTGSSFRINGKASINEDDNFTTNNEEINILIKLEMSSTPFDSPAYELIYDYKLYDDDMDTEINDSGFYRVTFMLEYAQGANRNYNLPENNEFILRVEVLKSQVVIHFNIGEGSEEWYYRGIPYEVLDMNDYSHGDVGVTYSTTPEVLFEDIVVEIYEVIYNGEEIVDNILVNEAINAGSYKFKIKAKGDNSNNYDDSEWIEQIFTIQKATITTRITGKEILPEDQHLFPNMTTYPLSKVYGEEIIEERYKVIYEGWVNGEDPYSEDEAKRPAEFFEDIDEGIIDWGELVDRYIDARPAAPYNIKAKNIQSLNYNFSYRNSSFTVYLREGKVLVNEEYTHSEYTGTNQRFLSTFEAKQAPENIDDEIMPYAFALNHNPIQAAFTISLTAKLVYNPETGEYERDTEINECVDVGRYIFTISAGSSVNYTAVEPQEFEYEVVKAELKAIIEDNNIIYGERYPSFTLTYDGYVGKDYEGMQANPSLIPIYSLKDDGQCELDSGEERVQNLIHPQLNIPANAINVGNYIIGLIGGSAENYYINLDDTAALVIERKIIYVEGSEYPVRKEYDGTMEADAFVSERNYEFEGVIKHYLKDEEDVVALSFSASFNNPAVGKNRIVKMQELAIDNGNYYLMTVEFDCQAEITKRTPNIRLLSKSFTYDSMPKELNPVIVGLPGDEVNYIIKYKGTGSTAYVESDNPPTTAGIYEVTVTTDDLNYVSMNMTSTLTIHKRRINISFGGDKVQTFGEVSGLSARAIGLGGYEQNLQLRYFDSEQNEIMNIITAPSGTYIAKAVYSASANYLSEQSQEELFINPKEVSITFVDTSSYAYDGYMKNHRATFYNINGELQQALIEYTLIVEEEEIFINKDNEGNILANIAPKDAGYYKAYAIAPNNNYKLMGEEEELTSEFTIVATDINIKVNDITINEGSVPSYTYTIDGIATGENVNTLDIKPLIGYYEQELGHFVEESPNKVGVYRILPYGASDKNYNITYSEGKLTINSVKLVANTTYSEGLMLEGSFSPETNLSVKVIQSGSYSRANTSFEVFKLNNQNFKPYMLSEIYEISIQEGAVQGDMITVKLLLNSDLKGADTYNVAHIKLDGSIEIIEVTPSSEDYLVFSVSELGNFSVMVEENKSQASIGIYLAIAGAVLVILFGLIIIKKKA